MYRELVFLTGILSLQSAQVTNDGSNRQKSCIFPSHPTHGSYVTNMPNGRPGETYKNLVVNTTCNQNFIVEGLESVYCLGGWWRNPPAKCVLSLQSAQVTNDGSNRQKSCIFPSHPTHGSYVTNMPNGRPGETYKNLVVNTTCNQNFIVEGLESVYCLGGWWRNPPAKCVYRPGDDGSSNRAKTCYLPPHPDHGVYVTNIPNGKPGDTSDYIEVNITCDQNYIVEGLQSVHCYTGRWPEQMPKCVSSPQPDRVIDNGGSKRPRSTCTLPPYPAHGTYVSNVPGGRPGDVYSAFLLNVTCHQKYTLQGSLKVFCYKGIWVDLMPTCIPLPIPLTTDGRQQHKKTCILPSYPAHATYTTVPEAKPGEALDIVAINVICEEGYELNGSKPVYCNEGHWQTPMPQCVSRCRLPAHPSVSYHCLVSGGSLYGESFRPCNEYEPAGTIVKPVCQPYYRSSDLKYMECKNEEWINAVQKCKADCGILTPKGTQLILNAKIAKFGEVPWHAAIYKKTKNPYELICGGSLISTNIVLSAAHCFWDGLVGKLPASDFVVAVGKLYRDFDHKMENAQFSNVQELRLPPHFKESTTNFQADIAVVELSTPIQYQEHIRPVCVDFDASFDDRQLQPGNNGIVAGWGLITEDGEPSQELRVVELPYVSIESCFENVPLSFNRFITTDKICAGYKNASTALCRGDSGGGLAFLEFVKRTPRYFLRGIASTAPSNDLACNANTFTTFTRVIKHDNFITRHWRE